MTDREREIDETGFMISLVLAIVLIPASLIAALVTAIAWWLS